MRRFLLGIFIIVVTLTLLVGTALLLSDGPKQEIPVETLPVATEQTVPETTQPETKPVEETTAPVVEEKTTIDAVPLYYQTDYPYIKFGNGTIATSGCSITCLAMVSSYMTDQEYTPPQMAYHFGSYGKTNIARLDYGITEMMLPYDRVSDVQKVLQAVKEGKIAIVMMDDESVFTNEQHFIVIAGMNEAGKFVVHDPLETNYLNADVPVRNCYDNGFDDFYLMRGFSGGWIFDKEDMKDVYFRYDASMPEQQENRYEGYTLTGEDIYTLACFVYAEARDEAPEVQQAVAEVVLNRVVSSDYPDTVHKVIYQTELYRAVNIMKHVNEPDIEQYMAVDAAMFGPYILPEDICFYSAWEKGKEPWGQLGSFTFTKYR